MAAVDLVRWVRLDLLTAREPSWAAARFLLSAFVILASAAVAVLTAASFFAWSRTRSAGEPLVAFPLDRRALAAIAIAAVVAGTAVRFAWLDRLPAAIWSDELVPVLPALSLAGRLADFRDSVRMIPTDGHTNAMAGVVYLEPFRAALRRLGTTLFTIRLPGALAGSLSLITGMLLARALLPAGGAAIAGLVLAGLRWQIILARFAWNAMGLVVVLDLATLLLVRGRRRSSLGLVAAGGLVAGIGAHLYLAAWIAAIALGLFLLWPGPAPAAPLGRRLALAALFAAGFLAAASPIFLLREGRAAPYFGRGSEQGVALDYRRTRTWLTPFGVLADSLKAPWFVPDPVARQDLPVSRLGWILGVPVAAALARALRSPRDELSAFLFAHAGAAVAGSMRWGFPGHPNGYRYLYLTTVTGIAAAAGVLWLVQIVPRPSRRAAAIAAIGLLAVGGAIAARDALLVWAPSRRTADAYWGEFTLIGRAALRWQRFGAVELAPDFFYSRLVVGAIREFALDPDARDRERRFGAPSWPPAGRPRLFRVAASGSPPRPGERRIEIVRDGWGRDYAVVYAHRR